MIMHVAAVALSSLPPTLHASLAALPHALIHDIASADVNHVSIIEAATAAALITRLTLHTNAIGRDPVAAACARE